MIETHKYETYNLWIAECEVLQAEEFSPNRRFYYELAVTLLREILEDKEYVLTWTTPQDFENKMHGMISYFHKFLET